jgi:predicted amidohydrolase YtcJ
MNNNTIFINGRFHTCDPATEGAQAIAVENGIITQVGDNATIKSLVKDGYEAIDLKNNCVLPGLIDAHLHFLSLGQSFNRVNLDGVDSLEKVKDILGKAAANLSPGQWLLGRGWNKNLWGDDFPDKSILDNITNHPAALRSKDGHLLWINSVALEFFRINKNTPDPPGGVIDKDFKGVPTGILKENAADNSAERIPKPSYQDNLKSIKAAQNHLLKLGITGVGDCDEDSDLFSIYNDLDEQGQLQLRVFKMVSRDGFRKAIDLNFKTGAGSEHLRIGCLKLFADGALGSQSALMFEPYEHSSGNYGVETLNQSGIEEYVRVALDAGISIAIHAIGDKANYQALSAIGKFQSSYGNQNLRPRIEHAQLLRKSDIDLFKAYNIIASVQPIHATSDRDTADRYWGKRSRYAYPFRTFLERGIKMAFGSDAPIETASPMAGIHAAVTRQRVGESRPGWYLEETITPIKAVEAYTLGSAHASCLDDICGSISVGKRADLVVLSDDIFEIKPDRIAQSEVLMTIIDGKIAYSQDSQTFG